MKFLPMNTSGIEAIEDAPSSDRILSGTPRFKAWNLDEADGGVLIGVWEATPGKWRFQKEHFEYCRILAGESVITEEGGEAHTVKAGDSFVMRAGFKGTWEVVETTRKDYVLRR